MIGSRILLVSALAALAVPSAAQAPAGAPPIAGPAIDPIAMLQNDLVLKSGTDRVYFGSNSFLLGPPARATLAAQARWLIANPAVRVMLEGHGDERDSREHALAFGERRANAVRDYLVSLGVPRSRLMVTSWGKERPLVAPPGMAPTGVSARVVTQVVR